MYELIPRPPASGKRYTWLLLTLLALILIIGSVTLFAAASMRAQQHATQNAPSSLAVGANQNIANPVAVSQVALPTATPRAQVIVEPPADGVDYETAVLMRIYEEVNPSVVNISIYQLGSSILDQGITGVNPSEYYPVSSGSGFVWDAQGNIVTNNHVVDGADRIVVRFSDGTMSVADVVGTDVDSDLAVVRMDPTGYDLVPVLVGNLDEVRVGQRVAAIGNPFGLAGTLTSGIVSAIGRSIPARQSYSIPASIQTDAPINPGNSGGPLLNERGEVIGVNAQIRSEERANSGIGFAIPISIVQRVVPALIAQGKYIHPFIGISGTTFSPICAQEQGLDVTMRGALVVDVLRGTPAQAAGLRAGARRVATEFLGVCPTASGGDLITAVEGRQVASFDDVLAFLSITASPGDTVTLTILRNGALLDVPLTLGIRPGSE